MTRSDWQAALLLAFLSFLSEGLLWAEETEEHQRLGVRQTKVHQFMPSLELRFQPQKSTLEESYTFILTPTLWYMFQDRIFAQARLPFYLRFYAADKKLRGSLAAEYARLGVALPEFHQSPALALGNLSLGLGLRYRLGASRLSFGINSSVPTGNNRNANPPLTSDGLLYLGGFFHFSQIIDPAIWALDFSYELGLPQRVQGVELARPGIFQLALSFNEYLNDVLSYKLGLNHKLNLPALRDGALDPLLGIYTLSLETALNFRIRDLEIESQLGLQLYPNISLPSLSVQISYLWQSKGNP